MMKPKKRPDDLGKKSLAPKTSIRPRPRPEMDDMIQKRLDRFSEIDQGTTDALPAKKYKNGGCVMSGRGGKYKGSM